MFFSYRYVNIIADGHYDDDDGDVNDDDDDDDPDDIFCEFVIIIVPYHMIVTKCVTLLKIRSCYVF